MNKIVIIAGTNRKESVSSEVAAIYKATLKEVGAESEIIDLKNLPEDFSFSALYDNAGKNADFNVYREKMNNAEKFVFIVPEYNGSFPGVLKAFIDGLKFPTTFADKKCALVGISSGSQGGGLAVSHLTDIFNYCGMNVLAQKPRLARIDEAIKDGKFTMPLYDMMLKEQINKFLIY